MDQLIESIIKTLTEKFGKNPSAPLLLISYLGDGEYYASIAKYNASFGQNKEILFWTKGNDLNLILNNIAKAMVIAFLPNQDELTKLKNLLN